MPTVFRPSTSKPITIGDEYRLFKNASAPPIVPVVDDVENNASESKEEVAVDAVKEEDSSSPKEEQQVEKKRTRAEDSGSDVSAADGEGAESTAGPPESKRSKTAVVPGEGTDGPQVGESDTSVRAEPEHGDAKQEADNKGSASEV
jgi:hypothetical protein